ncbi:hypothetical protein BDV27DRAFT_129746 [Aspergillus caelatus]|uniref:Uncharacterized protein n=2 Tax=Aspergillus subgen. Circumdati TaxID=2720871 RepID=A0A5N7A2B2_9EURO|nr:uncharacterized protein BDV27DRAFT_129746 [Aspergillus caelatus]KAE8363588.1 hypothetical protein BDV27DRAFT_129746 [Aspergillus caelatus]KAE8420584.1 hypothetical protein BDV36DRAFT_249185 [Aspergillus pseudocaelatus]
MRLRAHLSTRLIWNRCSRFSLLIGNAQSCIAVTVCVPVWAICCIVPYIGTNPVLHTSHRMATVLFTSHHTLTRATQVILCVAHSPWSQGHCRGSACKNKDREIRYHHLERGGS